jgi:hypothetical protein
VIQWTEGYKNPKALRFSKTFGADTNWLRKPRYFHAIGPDESIVVYQTTEDIAVRFFSFSDAAGKRWVRRDGQLTTPARPSLRYRFRLWRYRRTKADAAARDREGN